MLHDDARYVFDGLTSRALPLVILSAICGIGSLVLLLRGSHSGARLLAMGAVATVVLGWGVAQYPYILPTSLKLSAAAAPDPTLWSVVIVFVVAAIVILPSLGLLYYLDQRDLLETSAGTAARESGIRLDRVRRRHLGRVGRSCSARSAGSRAPR